MSGGSLLLGDGHEAPLMLALIAAALRFRLLAAPVAAGLIFLGVSELRSMPVDILPEFTPPYVEIQTEALGLSAAEVEQLLTVPLERDLLNGVAGIDVIRSESVLGLSSITLVFEPGTELLDARQLVQERLLQANVLPNVSKPPTMLQPLSAQSRVLMVGLSSEELSLVDMGVLARWTIRPRLMGVPGVANVVIWGQRDHELHALVDPARLQEQRVSLEQVVRTVGNAQLVSPLSFLEASTPGSGGFVDTANQRLQVRHIFPIADPAGLAQVPVDAQPRANGERLRLGDVATVVEAHQPLIGDAVVGGGTGLFLVIEKFPGASTLQVTRDVEAALDSLRPGLSGLTVDSSVFRPAGYLETAIDNLGLALLIGGILLALAFGAVLLDWRALLVAVISVPLSLLTAVLVISALGQTMNALVLAGLAMAVGIVADDSLGGLKETLRRLRRRRSDEEPADLVIAERTHRQGRSNLYSALVIGAAVLPAFLVPGVAGAFFEPVAVAYLVALGVSFAVSLTIGPALASVLLARGSGRGAGGTQLLERLGPRYASSLRRVLGRDRMAMAAAAAAAAIAIGLTPLLGQSLVPSFHEQDLLVHLEGAPGTSRPAMTRIAGRLTRELQSIPGVEAAGAHVGRAVMGDRVVGTSSSDVWVRIRRDADRGDTVTRIREAAEGYPGVGGELVAYSTDRIRTVGTRGVGVLTEEAESDALDALRGEPQPVVVHVYGKELDVIQAKAEEVRQLLAGIDGIVSPRVESLPQEPAISIEPDVVAARRHGIKPGDIRRAAATLVQGIAVGALFEDQKVFDVIVAGVPGTRESLSSVESLPIDAAGRGMVALSEVASVSIAPTPSIIRREAVSRRLDVTAGVAGRSLGDVLDDVEAGLRAIDFPLEYHAEIEEGALTARNADLRLVGIGLGAALVVFLLLQAAVSSWRLAGLVFLSLPVALSGGVVAALLTDRGDLSLGAAGGLLLVFGLAVRNSLTLVHLLQRRAPSEDGRLGTALVVQGAGERLAPVLGAALATLALLSPFLFWGTAPGTEILHPLAIVALGGLVTSTACALFVVPALSLAAVRGDGDRTFLEEDLMTRLSAQRPTLPKKVRR